MITPSFALTATERVLPKLALDFTTASLDPRVTFTRTGNTATVTNSSGYVVPINADLPRFDYDPVTLICKGLLIEESRTNLLKYSDDFSNVLWSPTNTTVSTNVETSPDGTINADKLIGANGVSTSSTFIYQLVTKAATSTTYSTSVYAKQAGMNRIRLSVRDSASGGNNAIAIVSLVNGSTVSVAASGTFTNASVSTTSVGNGWYRVVLTFTSSTEVSIYGSTLFPLDSVKTTANGTDGIYIWGAQLELGAFATSYIPTTTTALTRNADVATMTGTNFSDWYNTSEGTFSASFSLIGKSVGSQYALEVNDGTTNNRYLLYRRVGPDAISTGALVSGSVTAGIFDNIATPTINTTYTNVLAYKLDSFASSANATNTLTDSTGAIPTVDRASIGDTVGATRSFLNGHIKKINFWPQRLTNNEVQAFSKG